MTTTTEQKPDLYVSVGIDLHDDNTATITLSNVGLGEVDDALTYLGSEEARNEIIGRLGLTLAGRLADATGIPIPYLLTAAGMALLGL